MNMKWIHALLLLALLSGCQSAFLTDLVTAPGGVLYQEDFSDASSGWPRVSDTSGSMDYDGESRYRMTVQAAHYDLWATSRYSFADVRLEVDANIADGPQGSRYGLVCRYVDPKNFYFFVATGDGYEAIGKVKQGVQTLLGQELMEFRLPINTGPGSNHLRFDCIGSQLAGYVGDQSIANATDADFTNGEAGLIAGTFDQPGVSVIFDNFIVYKP